MLLQDGKCDRSSNVCNKTEGQCINCKDFKLHNREEILNNLMSIAQESGLRIHEIKNLKCIK